jgi:2-oxoisovalerate dehydrogenase E2 component (dihydrolipoyl transacylase)
VARFTFKLPDIGEGIAEAEIVAWHVKIGDRVEEDGRLADMMTDKATVEMESPVAGTIVEVAGEEGDVIAIGSPLVVIETEGDVADEAPAPEAKVVEQRIEAETPEAEHVEEAIEEAGQLESVPEPAPAPKAAPVTKAPPPVARSSSAKVLASPAVRARAKELGIDLAEVRAAEDGRVRHADLDAFLSYSGA